MVPGWEVRKCDITNGHGSGCSIYIHVRKHDTTALQYFVYCHDIGIPIYHELLRIVRQMFRKLHVLYIPYSLKILGVKNFLRFGDFSFKTKIS